MKDKPLVSLAMPCYNGEKYVEACLDSILEQTYDNIEVIFVNDGSVDGTDLILKQYKERFENRGYSLIYNYKKNEGQAAAINYALKCFNGNYFMWMDSDDILLPNNIEKKVDFLECHTDVGFVQCQANEVNYTDIKTPISVMKRIHSENENLFKDYIDGKNVVFCPNVMVRSSVIKMAIPDLTIYESREGQNYQLLLPISYLSKSGYIDEPLFLCVNHTDSHSRSVRSYKESIIRNENIYGIIANTVEKIPTMPEEEKEYWKHYSRERILKRQLQLAYSHKEPKDAYIFKQELKSMSAYEIKDTKMYFFLGKQKRNLCGLIRRVKNVFKFT